MTQMKRRAIRAIIRWAIRRMERPIYERELYSPYSMNPEDVQDFCGYAFCGLLGLDPDKWA